jgi:hypothetical protein
MLKVSKFIRDNNNWEELLRSDPYNVSIKHQNNLILLNYIQGASTVCDITNECRGLVLDIADERNPKVVRCGFYRFFNLGDPNAVTIGNHITAYEKVDGSLVFLYFVNDKWCFGTRNTFDLEVDEVTAGNTPKLRKMAKQIRSVLNPNIFDSLNKNFTYCFEFVSPDFQIIVPYEKPDMYLLMIRNNNTLEEVETAISVEFKKPKVYSLNSISEIEKYVSQFSATEFEGIVVKDENNNRIKIKNLNWLQLHYLYNNGQFSDRYFIHLYMNDDYQELLSYFTNLKERFNKVVNRYNTIKEAARLMDNIPVNTIMTKKQFFELVDRTVKDKGFQMLALKSYNNCAYNWFCMLDEHWYSHYFVGEER